jgi:hypothetical protein
MNLNEECLLQFLQNESAPAVPLEDPQFAPAHGAGLTTNLKRILRRKHYVSFPPAILIRRPHPTES